MSVVKPLPIPLVIHTVYPTMESLTDVIEYGNSCLPIMDENQLRNILMRYHNCVLHQLAAAASN